VTLRTLQWTRPATGATRASYSDFTLAGISMQLREMQTAPVLPDGALNLTIAGFVGVRLVLFAVPLRNYRKFRELGCRDADPLEAFRHDAVGGSE